MKHLPKNKKKSGNKLIEIIKIISFSKIYELEEICLKTPILIVFIIDY